MVERITEIIRAHQAPFIHGVRSLQVIGLVAICYGAVWLASGINQKSSYNYNYDPEKVAQTIDLELANLPQGRIDDAAKRVSEYEKYMREVGRKGDVASVSISEPELLKEAYRIHDLQQIRRQINHQPEYFPNANKTLESVLLITVGLALEGFCLLLLDFVRSLKKSPSLPFKVGFSS